MKVNPPYNACGGGGSGGGSGGKPGAKTASVQMQRVNKKRKEKERSRFPP